MEKSVHPRKTRKPQNKSTYCVGRAARAFYQALNQPTSCLAPLARTARPTAVPPKNENPVLYLLNYFRAFCAFRGRTAVFRLIKTTTVPQASVVYA
ncbi:hypothetical protein [Methylobacter sp.]|uniref:hypothetical protein n=1 Tax=Methylobacter sp. TaxID=2051955 RepID=UPI001224DC2C|nr:hypothetical protein [Methylobacter sp.]TAK60899.1 MAG: hypothetical protein EPO18_15635 [Methylobacter sp.]